MLVLLSHLVMIVASIALAFALRFDFVIPGDQFPLMWQGILIAVPLKVTTFHLMGLSRGWWRFIGILDLMRLFWANVIVSLVFTATTIAIVGRAFPRSIYALDFLVCFCFLAALRLSARLYFEQKMQTRRKNTDNRKRILIYGAGNAALTLMREISSNPSLGYEVVGLVDDDPSKDGLSMMGSTVLGPGRELGLIADRLMRKRRRVDEIVIAMPSASRDQMQEVLANCRTAGIDSKTVPGIGELLRGSVLATQIREVSITDLLGREPVQIDEHRVRGAVTGRKILVTGATGSIGSELCRQLLSFEPARLIAFDQAESELFRIEMELRAAFPNVPLSVVVGDIRDAAALEEVIRTYDVEAIFHAAAYKHVPLMEKFPLEAVRNNVLGTWKLVQAAYRNRVGTFVMISSDKAVNPSSIMGATKRLAELILSAMPTDRTKFVSVRFGNVLGSNGSVVPIFQKQIALGGPVTVTHPEMRRYFMTIPEAAQLVLVASSMSKGSEVFVLDMGEPVKIVDLAKTMIRLAGKVPDRDIKIQFTGMRVGEKLYEELSYDEELLPTDHKKILIFKGAKAGPELIELGLPRMERLLDLREVDDMVAFLKELVPEFNPDKVWQDRLALRVRPLAARAAAAGGKR